MYGFFTVEEFTSYLYESLSASLQEKEQKIKKIMEALQASLESGKEVTIHVEAIEISYDTVLETLRADQKMLQEAVEAVEDLINGDSYPRVDRLFEDYFNRIQEQFEMDPDDRIEMRIIHAEIRKIEKELEEEGFPIFGGISVYEDIMNEDLSDEGGCDCDRGEED